MDTFQKQVNAIVTAYQQMGAAFTPLAAAIEADGASRPAWVAEELEGTQDADVPSELRDGACRARAVALYGQWRYLDGQDPRRVLRAPGLIGVSPRTAALAEAFNEAKAGFREAVEQLAAALDDRSDEGVVLTANRNQSLFKVLEERDRESWVDLKRRGIHQVCLVQAARSIHVLPGRPVKAGFTLTRNTAKIKQINRAEAIRLIERISYDSEQYKIDRERVFSLQPDVVLAQKRRSAAHFRVNVWGPDKQWNADKGRHELVRRMHHVAMPLLYVCEPGEPLPAIRKPEEPTPRLGRGDVLIGTEPLIPTIDAYEYIGPPPARGEKHHPERASGVPA